jgi:N-formylglutamate amidohydrolase
MSIPYDTGLVHRFRQAKRITGVHDLGGFSFDLDPTVPYIVTAIHAGHNVRDELLPLMLLPEEGRRFEEDVATDRIIADCASTVSALDSRSEYDLNRPPDLALPLTPERFWGVTVYHTPPPEEMNRRSLEKYDAFYRFVGSYLQVLLERFGYCVVYDIHSYNISRQVQKGIAHPPAFNLGTALLDRSRWGDAISAWLGTLRTINVPGRSVSVAENLVFDGKGEFCRKLTAWDANILVLPTEISKVYMNEHTGVVASRCVAALAEGLRRAVDRHSAAVCD